MIDARANARLFAGQALIYLVFLVAGWAVTGLLPGRPLWSEMGLPLFSVGSFTFTAFHLVHILVSFPLFLYASLAARWATAENKLAADPASYRTLQLFERGNYSQLRHPMYGFMILTLTALGCSLCSPWGLGLAVFSWVVFGAAGMLEERFVLTPRFGDAYQAYTRRVRDRFFTAGTRSSFFFVLALMVGGMIFM